MRPFIILFTALLTFSGGVAAFSMSSVIKQAEVIRVNAVTAATNTAITVSTTIRGFAANDPYQIKKIDVPKATYMTRFKAGMGETGGLKGLLKRNAWYAGWAATMFAAGWAMDELSNQLVSVNGVSISGAGYCQILNSSGTVFINISNFQSSDECIAYVKTMPYTNAGVTYQGAFANAQGNFTYYNTSGGLKYYRASFQGKYPVPYPYYVSYRVSSGVEKPNFISVSDDALYNSLISKMLDDPNAASQAFMVPDPWPYPYPEVLPDTVPYIPGVTQSDQELLDLYAQGLLQSTNPNAAHYVTPEKLAEIAALAGQLQQGLNPEAAVDAANQAAQSPVTQAQLEELMKKQEAAEAKADAAAVTQAASALAPAATALDKLNDEKADLEGMITDAPTAQPPSTMPNIFKWTLPTGNCQPYPFTFTIQAGSAHADDNGAFCQTYNEVVHPLIFWFLNMLTAIYIFSIWSRTMTSVVGGR
ncbi:hypothetical protein [Aeromonas sp. FDAARGOS 1402]|uniref:hypothetical protein n=1 Tax=Aeromonas TaxID=642 RepID=UPI001C232ECA|nr:hypothetical protein [Aeromonas sp. FDAARGOS 1402]QWZ53610.1 hypothetical protein I6L32_17570 [Aeromonas sp. FDAARGOS 1402]